MTAVPLLRPREVVRAFERLGWQVARQRGSHIVMTKPGAIATLSVPEHATGRVDVGRVRVDSRVGLLPQPRSPVLHHNHGQVGLLAAFLVQHQKSLAVAGEYARIRRAEQQFRPSCLDSTSP